MKKSTKLLLAIFSTFLIISCSENNNEKPINDSTKKISYDFQENTEGWVGDFADYPNEKNVETFYELEFSHSNLPTPLDTKKGALLQSGNNHSDDLFMFIKKKIEGLEANKTYKIDFEIEIASDIANELIGIGGSPGEGVYIKAGGSEIEPKKKLNSSNQYRMNIDIGNQSKDGVNAKVIGDFANGTDKSIYTLKTLESKKPITIKSNSNGELWLLVGTDSGYEGKTIIYYNTIKVTIK